MTEQTNTPTRADRIGERIRLRQLIGATEEEIEKARQATFGATLEELPDIPRLEARLSYLRMLDADNSRALREELREAPCQDEAVELHTPSVKAASTWAAAKAENVKELGQARGALEKLRPKWEKAQADVRAAQAEASRLGEAGPSVSMAEVAAYALAPIFGCMVVADWDQDVEVRLADMPCAVIRTQGDRYPAARWDSPEDVVREGRMVASALRVEYFAGVGASAPEAASVWDALREIGWELQGRDVTIGRGDLAHTTDADQSDYEVHAYHATNVEGFEMTPAWDADPAMPTGDHVVTVRQEVDADGTVHSLVGLRLVELAEVLSPHERPEAKRPVTDSEAAGAVGSWYEHGRVADARVVDSPEWARSLPPLASEPVVKGKVVNQYGQLTTQPYTAIEVVRGYIELDIVHRTIDED